ncbi:hypothetical protein FH972_022569 [Carpinus fangiana]|uniref:F-box domain-containing protein n=1 Tax=Carpinus fangiana TaxID=176857 RepID=A0A5N6KSL6_9ROSI|nr:hypothetical protein FH972_022569 [Carpinus fangiana]
MPTPEPTSTLPLQASSHPDSSTLSALPDEIVDHILTFLPPESLAVVSGVSKNLAALSGTNLAWRLYCRTEWQHWHPRHNIRGLLRGAAADTDWKALFILRKRIDRQTSNDFEHVLAKQLDRIPHIESIVSRAYDAKDVLLGHLRCRDDAEDVLARRYWAGEILASIERVIAIDIWEKLRDGENVPLEHALGSLDLWIAQQPAYDLDDISARLDTIAADFISQAGDDMENVTEWSTRKKAVGLGAFLSGLEFLRSPDSGAGYRSLRNCLIGVVLADSSHNALQLVSAAIYCCVAGRIGLEAHLTNYPLHVYINVPALTGLDHDGRPSSTLVEPIFIEPWGGHEASAAVLKSQLTSMGQPETLFPAYSKPATALEMVNRMGNNILASIQELGLTFETVLSDPSPNLIPRLSATDTGRQNRYYVSQPVQLNPFRASYCVCWLQTVMRSPSQILELEGSRGSIQILNLLVQQLEAHQHDIGLVEKYVIPRYSADSVEHRHLTLTVSQKLRDDDAAPQAVKRRPSSDTGVRGSHNNYSDTVKHRVGDMFRHRRYNYSAVIIGWDPACMASQSWIDHMGVDTLPGGREQSFYNVFVEDQSTRYVAEENIGKVGGDVEPRIVPGPNLMREAGKWFKRFDSREQRFVSNMQDEYPDD